MPTQREELDRIRRQNLVLEHEDLKIKHGFLSSKMRVLERNYQDCLEQNRLLQEENAELSSLVPDPSVSSKRGVPLYYQIIYIFFGFVLGFLFRHIWKNSRELVPEDNDKKESGDDASDEKLLL